MGSLLVARRRRHAPRCCQTLGLLCLLKSLGLASSFGRVVSARRYAQRRQGAFDGLVAEPCFLQHGPTGIVVPADRWSGRWGVKPQSKWDSTQRYPSLGFAHFKPRRRVNPQVGGTGQPGLSIYPVLRRTVKNPPTPATGGGAPGRWHLRKLETAWRTQAAVRWLMGRCSCIK